MQKLTAIAVWLFLSNFSSPFKNKPVFFPQTINAENRVVVVTLDGYRWKELFTGADSLLLNDASFTSNPHLAKLSFWDNASGKRREKLMPFFWNVLAKEGLIYGNRNYGNLVDIANSHGISYPGYNEMFTGQPDQEVSTNARIWNERQNVFESLCSHESLQGKFAAFTSWDVFPYILNTQRNNLYVNSNNSAIFDGNTNQSGCFNHNKHCRNDMVTYLQAKTYLDTKKPNIMYIALGETDEYAHKGDYFNYLQKAKEADRIIEDLWYYIQTNEYYKDKTTLLITTDHGRGNGKSWVNHNSRINGSSEIWLAALGSQVSALGEVKEKGELKQKQLAATIANLFGTSFSNEAAIKLTD